ncbi:MAG TPA: peptide ligase PGM1-related protein [Acidimicrobiales bacterium]|nr:peptide ligase PGM1-related protein [Acidimicrobiales bacterium]
MLSGVEGERFRDLQRRRLLEAWRADLPGSATPHVVVGLPSYSVDRSLYDHYGDRVGPLEHRYLYVILRARNPGTRVVYLSSRPVTREVVDSYLSLAPAQDHDAIRANTLLISPDDPSPRALAEKTLDAPQVLAHIRAFIGEEPALVEAWNVTEAERDLAVALDVPLNGTDPSLSRLATKSGGRELFAQVGIPVPRGVEHVSSLEDVVRAIRRLRACDAATDGVVVKLDDSVAGDGNVVMRFSAGDDLHDIETRVRGALPEWYLDTLRRGGIVEELITGDDFCSPSGQGDICPDGTVHVLSTHDQRLGGDNGQVYEGSTFPARPGYARQIATHVAAAGHALLEHGAIGRYAVDFAAVRRNGNWHLFALEINLRKGGTTHTMGVVRLLTNGRYDPVAGEFRLPDGSTRVYGATDNLIDPSWIGRSPAAVCARLDASGLLFNRSNAVGVVPHLLDCLGVDGRMGYTAIGRTREEATEFEERVASALV